jgi:hypothetical protein
MKTKLHLGRGVAILVCVAALAAAVIAPTAASARGAKTCANKTVKLHQEGGSLYPLPVKSISTEGGVSCAEAYKVIREYIEGSQPAGWKSIPAHFEAPEGMYAQGLKKGGKKIWFATRGG